MVQVNVLAHLIESVDEALKFIGLPVTPHNRLEVLNGIHKKISTEGVTHPEDRLILQTIEDEIIRLTDAEA